MTTPESRALYERFEIDVAADRLVEVGQWGDPDGLPVFFFHGACASWRYRHPDDDIATGLGIRLLTAARPGFGASTRQPGRSVASWVADVVAVADALDIEHFAVLGHSGGGPYAIACAVLAPQRVASAASVGSLAPFTTEGRFHALAAAEPLFRAAADRSSDLEALLQAPAAMWTSDPRAAVRMFIPTSVLDSIPGIIEVFATDVVDALAHGTGGWTDELRALTADWGFEPATGTVPFRLWYGREDELLDEHGAALAAATRAPIRLHEGGHHDWVQVWDEMLDDVTRPMRQGS